MPALLHVGHRAAPPAAEPQPPAVRGDHGGRDVLVARVAAALIALHVAADAFVAPEPGTAAADHLAGGLIPLAILAVLAFAYPRLRAGWQALLAGSVGALALVTGIGVSARHVAVDRLAGDDVTGLVAGLAGAALAGCALLAARRAWRLRSRERSVRCYARRGLLALGVACAALYVVLPIAFSLLATHKARSPVADADLGRPYEDVTLRTTDGLTLRGWYVPSSNRAAVIAFPGRSGPVEHARMLARRGYGVLLFDRRGEGESEGDYNAFGWGGERDLDAAIAWLATRPDVDRARIGGLGLSVGGELLLQTQAHAPLLRAVVSDGAGVRSIRDHVAAGDRGPLDWISPLAVQTAATAVLANSSPPPPLTELVARIAPRAAFFVHAGRGSGGEDLNPIYHAAAAQPKQLWQIPEATHTGGIAARPTEYESRVVGFFHRHLLGR